MRQCIVFNKHTDKHKQHLILQLCSMQVMCSTLKTSKDILGSLNTLQISNVGTFIRQHTAFFKIIDCIA